jgi:transglutaminase-like putative cysteine protease
VQLRLSRRDGEAFAAVPLGASQRATSGVPTTTSEVFLETLQSVVPDTLPTGRAAPARDALRVYLASTTELDLTDKMLRTRAAKLAQGSPSDVETARRVWTFVSTSFDYKLGATLFATSREALRDLKGDCSEAAVLTAALLRAAGIPSRVVLGYATLGQGVWIGHAWAEAWLGGTRGGWVGVDAALREFPTGPHRVALVTLSGTEDMKAAATNLMLSTISNLDIEITGAWAGDQSVPLITHPAAAAESQRFWKQVMEGMGR